MIIVLLFYQVKENPPRNISSTGRVFTHNKQRRRETLRS
jgi:hypothetical protein